MEICNECKREFKNKYSLANHVKSGCNPTRTSKKLCKNHGNYEKCKKYYVFSKSELCRSCSNKINYNDVRTGKTYEEIYGDIKAKQLKYEASVRKTLWNNEHLEIFLGDNNPNYGKKCINYGKTWEEIHGLDRAIELKERYSERLKNLTGENNIYIKSLLNKLNITYEEYLSTKTDYEIYRYNVCKITKTQPIYLLEYHNYRGKSDKDGSYHLDHIYPIKLGFINKIDPEIIGNIINLRFIPWKENLSKSHRETQEVNDIFIYMIEQGFV